MSVPNEFPVVRKLFDTGVFDLTTHEGQGAFTDAVVSALHARDERFGHLKKNPGQTHVHGHGEDAALYLSDVDGQSQAVDFIGGAGGSNPQPAWQVDIPRYSKKDWANPTDHGFDETQCPPVPILFPYPNEPVAVLAFQNRVKKAYNDVGRIFPDPNDSDAYRHFTRYGYSCHTMPEPDAANKHIKELRAQLGAPESEQL